MHFGRTIWIGVLIVLIGSGSLTLLDATGIDIFSVNYVASVRTDNGCGDFKQSFSAPVSATNCLPSGTGAFTSQTLLPSSGSLGTNAFLIGFGIALATASMDFYATGPVNFNLSTFARGTGGLAGGLIQLTNLTDAIVLLRFEAFGGSRTGSFTFSLDPSKDYRLEATSSVGCCDAAQASVNFSGPDFVVSSVPEPSSLALLLLCLPVLGIARSKLRKVSAQSHDAET